MAIKCALDVGELSNFDAQKWDSVLSEEVLTVVLVRQTPTHFWVQLTDMAGIDVTEKLAAMSVKYDPVEYESINSDVDMASSTSMTIPETSDNDDTIPLEIISENFPLDMVEEETTSEADETQPEEIVKPELFAVDQVAVIVEPICDSLNTFLHEVVLEQDEQKIHSTPQEVFAEIDRDVTMESLTQFEQTISEIAPEDETEKSNHSPMKSFKPYEPSVPEIEIEDDAETTISSQPIVPELEIEEEADKGILSAMDSFEPREPSGSEIEADETIEKSHSPACSSQNDSVYSHGQHTPPPEREVTTQLTIAECHKEMDNAVPVSLEERQTVLFEVTANDAMATEEIKNEAADSNPTVNPLLSDNYIAQVYVSHITTPGEFSVQLAVNEQSIGDIDSQVLQLKIGTEEKYVLDGPPVIGQLYAVRHPEYGNYFSFFVTEIFHLFIFTFVFQGFWYRAELKKVGPEDAVVYFVEYGDCQVVPISHVRKLPRILQSIPFMAIPCKMAAVHLDHWPQKSIDIMKNICRPEKLCQAVFRERPRMMDQSRWEIAEVENLFADDVEILELVEASLEETIPPTISPPVSPPQNEPFAAEEPHAELVFVVKMETVAEVESLETTATDADSFITVSEDSSALTVD